MPFKATVFYLNLSNVAIYSIKLGILSFKRSSVHETDRNNLFQLLRMIYSGNLKNRIPLPNKVSLLFIKVIFLSTLVQKIA